MQNVNVKMDSMEHMKKKQKKKSSKKNRKSRQQVILDEASQLFLERGYREATVNELLTRVGGSRETFYRHFQNKEGLFDAVLDKELGHKMEDLTALDVDHLDVDEALKRIAKTIFEYVTSERAIALRRLAFYESGRRPEIGQSWYAHGPEVGRKFLVQYFEKLQDKKIMTRFEPRYLHDYFLGMLMHQIMLKYECGVIKKPGKRQLSNLIERVVSDFIEAFAD